MPAILLTGFQETHDMGMIELAQDVDFALESRQEAGIDGQFRSQDLDGRLLRLNHFCGIAVSKVDAAHAAAAKFLIENPGADSCADHDASLGLLLGERGCVSAPSPSERGCVSSPSERGCVSAPSPSERGCVSAPSPSERGCVSAPSPSERGCVSAPSPSERGCVSAPSTRGAYATPLANAAKRYCNR